jgi:PhnB protein
MLNKMKQIHSYLTFNGNCREAMNFYQECLGGELFMQTIGESPMSEMMPPQMKDSLLHATLTNGNVIIMGSDMVDNKGLIRGNAMSMMLNCSSEIEIRETYDKLASGGDATHPLENTFWGSLFGGLTDKFEIRWILHFPKNQE